MARYADRGRLATTIRSVVTAAPDTRRARSWHVVLLNDEEHTFAYVVEMLGKVFGHSQALALELALEAHGRGRAVVYTGPREQAEWKRERVQGYGPDWRMPRCAGSCTALLEPAE